MNIKKIIKNSYLYQLSIINSLRPISQDRAVLLPVDERTEQRLCFYSGDKVKQLLRMMRMIEIRIRPAERYQTWIDTGLVVPSFYAMIDNIPPNYSLIVDYSLEELMKLYASNANKVTEANYVLLCGVENYVKRVIKKIDDVNDIRLQKTKEYFIRMLNERAESLEEAFQRILFWSSLFWQSRHRLVGLGRLDVILQRFANESDDIDVISDFLRELHRYYGYKSNKVTLGDTGQIIILGGKNSDNSYFYNELTYQFIRATMQINLPDPKLLLRVSSEMPAELLQLAIECISTGIGCPLLSNDDIVIPALVDFGYSREDAYNYVTSACWEPVAYGKSLEKNNIRDLNYANAIVRMYKSEFFINAESFEQVVELYKKSLSYEMQELKRALNCVRWEPDPLMSLFTEGCVEKGKDISEGGAIYSDYGILGVGISNAVNSLLNIKHLVFEQGSLNLYELRTSCLANYQGSNEVKCKLKNGKYFGKNTDEVVSLTRGITEFVFDNLHNYTNCFGGKLKWGLSSSNYLENGKTTEATLDGRCNGEPLGVHISCLDSIPYTELISFASRINYNGNRSNGNVVDFFVSPSMFHQNKEKFQRFIEKSIKLGFFQMQMNVVDSKTLIDAKLHPSEHKDLIVRVWGFSAYFNDLPESYKDVLINRSLQSEGFA